SCTRRSTPLEPPPAFPRRCRLFSPKGEKAEFQSPPRFRWRLPVQVSWPCWVYIAALSQVAEPFSVAADSPCGLAIGGFLVAAFLCGPAPPEYHTAPPGAVEKSQLNRSPVRRARNLALPTTIQLHVEFRFTPQSPSQAARSQRCRRAARYQLQECDLPHRL